MSKRTLGSLADLAKILEEAADPNSTVREDRQVAKPAAPKKPTSERVKKPIDPKRRAWYERRLKEREQAAKAGVAAPESSVEASAATPELTRAAATKVGGTLLQVLAAAKTPKSAEPTKRPEAWRRKPGDPVF